MNLTTKPNFDIDKIKFATDEATFKRAIELYENGKVQNFTNTGYTYTAIVLGSRPYDVFVSNRNYDQGNCTCYLGQNETLCKHMVAVAICAALAGKTLKKEDKKVAYSPKCSGKIGELSDEEIMVVRQNLRFAEKFIKPYQGPSKIWFAYQDSLSEGCNRLSAIISELPVSDKIANLIVKLLLRLDKKLTSGGVDDSDGTVGGFIQETVDVLVEYAKLKPTCVEFFHIFLGRETSFGWEEPLLKIYKRIKINN